MMEVGVLLPPVDVQREQRLGLAAAARHAEDVGLDSVWHGDHLMPGGPSLDCAVALAAAATATTRIRVGASVFIPALRPLVWAAKQVASLQHVADGRLVLGVGSGTPGGQWAAAGAPYAERGKRTDAALEALPALLRGERVRLVLEPERPEVELAPAVPPPPLWVGNASGVAIRRAARLGDGWFPSLVQPADIATGARRLAELAATHGRPVPTITVGAVGAFGTGADLPDRAGIAAGISEAYGVPKEEAMAIPVMGGPEEAAERLAAYRDAGAEHVAMGIAGGDWRRQAELLAEARVILARS